MTDAEDLEAVQRMGYGGRVTASVFGLIAAVIVVLFNWSHCFFGKGVGGACSDGGDCRTGECLTQGAIAMLASGICTKSCNEDGDCGQGNRCATVAGGKNCVPSGTGKLGDPCTAPWTCESMHCLSAQAPSNPFGVPGMGGAFPDLSPKEGKCADRCGPDDSCPEGSSCIDVEDDDLCVPDDLHSEAMMRALQEMMRQRDFSP